MVQRAVRTQMRKLHREVELGAQSWPALLTIHEARCRRAAEWENKDAAKKMGAVHVTGMQLSDNDMYMTLWLQYPQIEAFGDNDTAEVVVSKLQQSPKSAIVCAASVNALAWIAAHAANRGAVVAAGAVPACVRILQEGPDDAKSNAAHVLISISPEDRGALVAVGADEYLQMSCRSATG